MIFDQLFNPIFAILGNPVVLVAMFALVGVTVILLIIQDQLKKAYEVWYFSESERIIEVKDATSLSPKQIKAKDNYRFMRNSVAYTLRRGAKTVIVWLAKRGTAYTFRPTQTGKDAEGNPIYQRVGTLWEGLESCLGEDTLGEVEPEVKQKLMASKIFVTVDLEAGTTPAGFEAMSEQDVYTEANNDMASLIGHRIRHALNEIDYIEKIALMGSGGLVILVLQGMGILPAFGV